jgi:hypothetical protein
MSAFITVIIIAFLATFVRRAISAMLAGWARRRHEVEAGSRALVIRDGAIERIEGPGPIRLAPDETVQAYRLDDGTIPSDLVDAYVAREPARAASPVQTFTAGPAEIVVLLHRGEAVALIEAGRTRHVWREAGPWTDLRFALDGLTEVHPDTVAALGQPFAETFLQWIHVSDGWTAILLQDGRPVRIVGAGITWFWPVKSQLTATYFDLEDVRVA